MYWGVPGSELSDQLEQEVDVEGGVVYPEYPFYDKPLGTLALLKTPELKIKKTSHDLKLFHEIQIVMGDECRLGLFEYHEIYFEEEDFKFYFNPEMNIDSENTEILASIVIQPKPEYIDDLFQQPVCCDPPNTDLTLNEVQLTVCGNQNNIDLSTALSIGKNFIKGADEYAIFTPPVPLDFINELDAGFMTYGALDILTDYDILLRLNVSFVSKDLGKDLKPIRNNQVLTFPVSATITNTSPDYNSYDLANNPIRSDVWGQWDTEVLDEGYNFYDDYIQIVGNLSSPTGATSSLISTSVIHLKPETHISKSIRMAIDYPFEGLYPQNEVTSTYVSAFCQNNVPDIQYQANQFAATAPLFEPNLQYFDYLFTSLDDNYSQSLFVSPNPARDLLTLRSSHLDMSSITIHDLSGRPIEQKNLTEQTRQY